MRLARGVSLLFVGCQRRSCAQFRQLDYDEPDVANSFLIESIHLTAALKMAANFLGYFLPRFVVEVHEKKINNKSNKEKGFRFEEGREGGERGAEGRGGFIFLWLFSCLAAFVDWKWSEMKRKMAIFELKLVV